MNIITKEALEFVDEAKEAFRNNDDLTTYRNDKETFIALRTGFREDGLMVYELGNPVGNFTEQLPQQHKVLVDYDTLEYHKKLKKHFLVALERAEELISIGSDVDFNKGVASTIQTILKSLPDIK